MFFNFYLCSKADRMPAIVVGHCRALDEIYISRPSSSLSLSLSLSLSQQEMDHSSSSPFDCILFDLDDTLYSSNLGIAQACKRNIEVYLGMKCGVSEEKAASLRVELFRTYGSSLAGLIALGYEDVDADDYHRLVHGTLPYERIRPDPQLRDLLLSIPQTKIIFTNSDRKHVSRVLQRLGVEEECFNGIICFETLNPLLFDVRSTSQSPVILKPSLAAVETAVHLAGCNPHHTLFLDDNERNIAAGKAVGLHTALVGKRELIKEADYLVGGMSSLKHEIPEIWGKKLAESIASQGMLVKTEQEAISIQA